MKTAILFHGTGGSDKDYFWYADIKKYLEEHGYTVWWPLLPNTDNPKFEETLNFVEQNLPAIDEETIFIGHSSGCPLILTLLQYVKVQTKQAILVSGYYQPIKDQNTSLLQKEEYDLAAIKKACKEIIIINSDNDPWGCNDKQARSAAEKLGAKFILAKGEGHMGSGTFNQPYREHELVKSLIVV